jgi:glycosyltransferase involved in cell wall biosynthesis/O-antigen ligase
MPLAARVLGGLSLVTVPLIAWSRDVAVATVILATLSFLLSGGRRFAVRSAIFTPAGLCGALFFVWSFASVLWAPHLPWDTWLKTSAAILLGALLSLLMAGQSDAAIARTVPRVLFGAIALFIVLAIERATGGFFIGLDRTAQTVFQRLTTLSGGLVLLCTTSFACAALLSRYVGALVAYPLWIGATLAVSVFYPMDAEVAAILCGAAVFMLILIGGRQIAVALMALMAVGMVGWGFFAESAAGAGLHRWLIDHVDPNWGYRVEIWRYVHELIQGRIVQGYGFDSARVLGGSATMLPSFEGKTTFLHPHNGMLQIWLELGGIGVALFLATAILGFKKLLDAVPSRMVLATICATVTTSAVLWSLSFGIWQGWWLAVLGLTAAGAVCAVRALDPQAHPRKRLLFLVTEFYFFDALRKELIRGPQEQGYEIFVAARCRPGDLEGAGGEITIIPFAWKRSPSILVSLTYFVPDIIRVGRVLTAISPDVLHNIALKPSILGSLAAMGRKMAVINAIHGFGFIFMSRALMARAVQAACGLVLKLSVRFNDALILLINRHDMALVQGRMGLPHQNLRLIHGTGIDLEKFIPLPAPPETPFRFLVIGRLLYMKGIHIVVEALRLLRERGFAAELTLCGAPDPDNPSSIPESVLNEWKQRPGLTFAGQVPDVKPYIAACHVLVLPSLGGEGLPRALSEAAASGRALIATDIPGSTEIVMDRRTGLVVPPGDAPALASAMQWMMEHPADRQTFAEAARGLMEQEFSSARVAEAHAALYSSMPAHSAPARKL